MAPPERPGERERILTQEGFAGEARGLGLTLTAHQLEALAAYRDAIAGGAGRYGLTAVRAPIEIERRHLLESLAFGAELVRAGALPGDGQARVIDIGTGAGVPGIVLKIAWPAIHLSLLESNGKRCDFLRSIAERLKLEGADVLQGRAEDWGRDPAHRAAYDLAIARAVAPLPVLLEYGLPFLRQGGLLAAPKGSASPREVTEATFALHELGGEVESASPFRPTYGPPQTLVLVRKAAPTPDRYPRRAGMPGKRPLGGG